MKVAAKRSRAWCFTLNNYTDEEIENIKGVKCRYIIFGKELAPTTGTPHLQGYVYFNSQKTFSACKKTFKTDRIHIEVANGTGQQNKAYCSKGEDVYEQGDMPSQGSRSDIEEVKEQLDEGANIRQVVETATSMQSIKYAQTYMTYLEKPRDYKPYVIWYYGETGCGKTKQAYKYLGEDLYVANETGKWWDGYDAHENVLIDDMRKDFMKFHNILKMLDRYQFRVEVKGGYRQFKGRKIIITSPYHPADMYKTREDINQLLRRIDEIVYLGQYEDEDAYRNDILNNTIDHNGILQTPPSPQAFET